MKVSELKKALAPTVKGPLKAIRLPHNYQGKTCRKHGKSWHRDVKSDEKARRLRLEHETSTLAPHYRSQVTEQLKAFVDRINKLINEKFPDCDIRLELDEFWSAGFSDTSGETLTIFRGEVQA